MKNNKRVKLVAISVAMVLSTQMVLAEDLITDFNGLKDALKNATGSSVTVKLGSDISATARIKIGTDTPKSVTILGESKKYTSNTLAFDVQRNTKLELNNITLEDIQHGSAWGGAMYNEGTLTLDNVTFNNNIAKTKNAVVGGAMALVATKGNPVSTTIKNSTFTNNSTESKPRYENNGGAIYVYGTSGQVGNNTLNISDSLFESNHTNKTGGAIGVNNIGPSKFEIEINDTTFKKNNSTGYGGAIDVTTGGTGNVTINLDNTTFNGNKSKSDGGAIAYEKGNITSNIINSTFTNNTANNGGAIYNFFNSTMTISNSSFEDNTTLGYGGAIANFGELTLENTSFKNNNSDTNGGAIYNSNNLTIKATGGNEVEITDNKAISEESTNGIHNGGYLYLTADNTSSITFNDNIGGYGNIYITDENTGTINFNNKISTQSIHLNGGTLALGQNASIRTTDYFDTVNLTLNGGTFSMKNDRIDEVTVASLTIGDNNPNYTFDVNISDIAGASDKIIVNGAFDKNANGSLNLGPLNILAGMADDQIRSDMEFSNKDINAVIDEVNKHIIYNGTTYDIYAEGNKIIVMRGGYAIDFAHAILDDTNLERTYQIPNSGENVTDWLNGNNNLVGTKFQLLGGNGTKTIQGNNIEGIIIGTYNGNPQNYIVKDVDSYTGFYSAIINNGGIVDITNTTFNNNNSPYDGGAIQNNSGTVNINNGVSFTGNKATYNGGAIYNGENGTINFNLTNAGDSVNFQNNVNGDIYNAGTVNFIGEGEVSFTGGILGTVTSSMVNNGAKVSLSGPNLYYEGEYIQNSGVTTVLNQFTKGTTTINGGDVSWLTDCDYGTKVVFNGGKLYIG